jgi:hypothetical protein
VSSVRAVETLSAEDLWDREVYSETGQRLGRVEAVGMGRDRVPRRIGVGSNGGSQALRFFRLTEIRLSAGRVIATQGDLACPP